MKMYFQPESAASLTKDIIIAEEPHRLQFMLSAIQPQFTVQHEGSAGFY